MKNQEKDLKNENTGNTERKLTKEELTAQAALNGSKSV